MGNIDYDHAFPLTETLHIDRISSIYYFDFTKDFYFAGEEHDYWELVYTDKGEMIATAEDQDFFLRQGEIIFHKPNAFHKLRSNGVVASNVVIISFHCYSKAMSYFEGKYCKVPPEYRWIIAKLIEEGQNTFKKNTLTLLPERKAGGEQLIRNYLEMLLIYLMREEGEHVFFSEKNISENHIVCDMITTMEKNLYGNVDMNAICEQLHYSKTYLYTLFKEHTGHSPMEYYIKMKIEEAKRLLREKNDTVTSIADKLCFSNSHYFSHVFGKVVGKSPREYMKSVNK